MMPKTFTDIYLCQSERGVIRGNARLSKKCMEVQSWLKVCDIHGVPAHQLSCGQVAPTLWIEKYCALTKGKLWMLEPQSLSRLFNTESYGNTGASVLNNLDNSSNIHEEYSCFSQPGGMNVVDLHSSANLSSRRQESQNLEGQEGSANKNFLQKKLVPSIRRTRSSKHVTEKENRPFVDMTSLLNQGGSGRQSESDFGISFVFPMIESPDVLELCSEDEAIVRPLHHSILGRDHCFEVITVNGSRCFCCKSAGEREAWIEKIKRTLNPNLDNSRRIEHELNLWVQEAKGIPVKKKYFCEICLDRQLYARTTTKLKDDSTTFWGEHFEFSNIPDIENITVHLYKDSDKKKKKDKDYMGLVNIPVQYLVNGQITEKWYALSTPSGNNKNKYGETMAVRIKARFRSVCILPMENYKAFAEFISEEYMELCKTLHPHISVAKKDELSQSLVSIMHSTGSAKDFMTELVMVEITNVEEESLIFRENTIATKAVEHFLRLVGMGYLHEALGDFVHALYESDEDCEVDGSRLPASAILEHNQKNLQMCCEIAMCKIINSIKIFPRELQEVFSAWRTRCEACDRPRIASRLVTASLFLRLLCPAILNPSLFGLANELPRPNATRTLTLVAKVIQNLANRSRFGDKEEYMKFMNGFVREQWDQMGQFIDGVSDASKPPMGNGFEGFIDLGYELAKLHTFFVELLPAADQELVANLGNLPEVITAISRCIDSPPASRNGSNDGFQSSTRWSLLDKVAEDAHLSNAKDSILHSSNLKNAPFMDDPGAGEDACSVMDLCAEGLSFTDVQTTVPVSGSCNNSNNSHGPSPAADSQTELSASELGMPDELISRHPFKPPLSFCNPTYLHLHPSRLLRVVSSPAPLTIGENLHSGEANRSQGSLRNALGSSFKAGQLQETYKGPPLSFANPLQAFQRSTIGPFLPNSHLETVFTTETVTYATNVPVINIHKDQAPVRVRKMLVDPFESSGGSNNGDQHNDDSSLSSRPSSSSSESVLEIYRLECPETEEKKPGGEVAVLKHDRAMKRSKSHSKDIVVAKSANFPVASALHRTGLQNASNLSFATKKVAQPMSVSSCSIGDETTKKRSQFLRRCNVQNNKTKVTDVEIQSELTPLNRVNEEELVHGPITSMSMNVASAMKVRMSHKTRQSPTGELQTMRQEAKLANRENFKGRKHDHVRQGVPEQLSQPPTLPPATPEDPLSPEERTAQWILNNVAPVAKQKSVNQKSGVNMPEISSFTRSTTADGNELTTHLETDVESLRYRLSEASQSNRLLKQREEYLIEQVKEGGRRESHLQEKIRMLDLKLQKQVQDKAEIGNLLSRISDAEIEQKREREDLRVIIDEKDRIVAAQRGRIDSLEKRINCLRRAVNESSAIFAEDQCAIPNSNERSLSLVGDPPLHASDDSNYSARQRRLPHNLPCLQLARSHDKSKQVYATTNEESHLNQHGVAGNASLLIGEIPVCISSEGL